MRRTRQWLTAALLLGGGAAGDAQEHRDWAGTLRTDARAFHDDVAANHPGPVNAADPGFARRNDAQLALALDRARTATSFADYFFALRLYAASFDDGHVGFGVVGKTPEDTRWPGFLTTYDARGAARVVERAEWAPVPVGARLLACDGRSAEWLGAERLGRSWGRWQLESQRRQWGPLLFVDEGSRYLFRPARCSFDVDGATRTVALDWRPMTTAEFGRRWRAAAPSAAATYGFAMRTLADGTRWFSIPSFDGDPGSTAGKALPPMIAAMRADRPAIAAAPAIVLDLRDNGGGSSDWSQQIAAALWGPAALTRLPRNRTTVDWRASTTNLAAMETTYAERRDGAGFSPDARRWFETTIAGLRGAIARRAPFWHEADDETPPVVPAAAAASSPPLATPVYVLTDGACASACLDALDLWLALGAIHVGRTTSADTLYMDTRQFRLPSGLGSVSVPMKVYRGRPRGDNIPVVPVHRFTGDVADTPALERWIAGLRAAPHR